MGQRGLGMLAVAGCLAGCAAGAVGDESAPAATERDDAIAGEDELPAPGAARPFDGPLPVALLEDEACERVAAAIVERALGAGCWVTMHVCPDLLRVDAGEACLLYDRAAVDACVASLAESDVCGSVAHVPCGPLALPSSAPAGCMLGDEPPP